MAEIVQGIKPYKLDLDSSETLRDEFNAQFIGNIRYGLNINSESGQAGNPSNQGGNIGIGTPIQTLDPLCEITLPEGDNICTGAYQSVKTQEIYYEVWNSESEHSVWVYGTEAGECRKVYQGACLNFQFPSQYHIPEHRTALFVVYDNAGGEKIIRNKFYVFTDGYNWQFFIDVESAIATDSYNPISFPYFTTFYPHCDPCEFIQLGVRPPQRCPEVLPVDTDVVLQVYDPAPENNNLKEKVWYFATSFIDHWGRHSVISPYSTAVFLDGGDCNDPANDIKCFNLVLDAGSAIVEKIVLYWSNDGVAWFQYDVIDKWEDCDSPAVENFWERSLALKNYFEPIPAPSDTCESEGAFTTTTYTWDFADSPDIDLSNVTVTIIINGDSYDYTTSGSGSLIEIQTIFTQLGFDPFQILGDTLVVSSIDNVYGSISIDGSPFDVEIEPDIDVNVTETGGVNTFIYQFCGNKQCIPVDPNEVSRLFDNLPIVSVAQAIIDDRLAYGDNLTGYDNFICPIENIVITAVQDEALCDTGLVKIIVRAVIENFADERNNPITQLASSSTIAFGGYGTAATIDSTVVSAYNQQIANEFKGFIGGLRGTPYKTVSRQFRFGDPDNPFGVPQDPSTGIITDAYNGNYFYQQWEFEVPKTTYYIFELYSHLAEDLSSAEGTSTYFFGTIDPNNYTPTGDIRSSMEGTALRELLIPACTGDYTYPDYIVIADLSQSNAHAVGGYLREQDTGIAVELADTQFTTGTNTITTIRTDANGFWFAMSDVGAFVKTLGVTANDCNVKNATTCSTDGARFVQCDKVVPLSAVGLSNYNDCAHSLVTGRVVDCNGNPRSGVPIMIQRTGRVSVTDMNGYYTILVHDDAYRLFNEVQHRAGDLVIFGTNGSCIFTNGCDCNPCLPAISVNFNFCFSCPVVTQTLADTILGDIIPEGTKGVKTGGTYPVSIIGYDYLGRNNFAQRIGFYTVPTIQSNGVFAPYHFNWNIIGNLNLPSWVKFIRFAIGYNDYTFVLSWATNKVEFVDPSGNVTAPAVASNIKIYIDGLIDFNLANNLQTNTTYNFVPGDRIRFIADSEGNPYTVSGNDGLIDLPISASATEANVLLIPFDARLIDLEAGATFEIYRIPVCEAETVYLEQCPSIPVFESPSSEGGEPIVTSGTIPFFDTYWFYRTIPSTDQNGLPVTFVSPNPYEHHSPSDFWGDHKIAIGRPFVRNENARQTWNLDEIRWSDSLLEDGNINGLGTWRVANVKDYGVQNFGGIVAMHAQRRFLFVLCENDWFIVSIDDNLLRITQQGEVYANTDGFLSESQQKIGNIFGCDLRDTSTILFKNEWISWVDVRKTAVCLSDYQRVWDVTIKSDASEGGVKSYFIPKLRYLASKRDENQFGEMFMYLVSGYDPRRGEIIFTFFARTNTGDVESEGLSNMFGTALTYLPSLDYYQNPVWNDFVETVKFQVGVYTVGAEDRTIHFVSRTGGFNSIPSSIVIPRVGMGANLDEIYYYTQSTGGAYNLQAGFNATGVDFFPASVAYAKAHNQTFLFTANVAHGTVSEMAQFLDYLVTQGIDFKVRYGNEMSTGASSSVPTVSLTSGEYLALVLPFDDYVKAHYPNARRIISAADRNTAKWDNNAVAAFAVAQGIEEFTQYGWLGDLAGSPNTNTNIVAYFNEAINVLRDSVSGGNHSLYGEVMPRILGYATTFAGMNMNAGQYGVSLQRSGYATGTMLHGILIWNELFEFFKFNAAHNDFISSAIFLVNESAVDKKIAPDNNFTINPAWTVTDGTNVFVKRIQGVAYEMFKDLSQYRGTPIYLTVDRTGFPARFDIIAYQLGGRVVVYIYNLTGAARTLTSIPISQQSGDGLVDRISVYATQLYGSIGSSPAYTNFKNNGFNPGLAANNVLLLEETISDTNISIPINSITTLSFEIDAADDSTELSYANERVDYELEKSETISFNYFGRYWSGTYGFTPEYYICFQSGALGDQLLSFVGGSAWMHHNQNPSALTYNNFYGTNAPKALQLVFNKEGNLQKRFLALRVECKEHLWESDSIQTQTGQLSRIPITAFEMIENYSEGEILCDENTTDPSGISALIDGDSLYGNWVKIRLIGDEEFINSYCEIQMVILSSTLSY